MRALLFSGGLDSSALAYWLRPDICLTIDYGQKAAGGEVAAATAIASELRLHHQIVKTNLSAFGSGQLAGKPAVRDAVAPEFWPFRNQMLITLAGMILLPDGLKEIMVGAVATDLHADGRSPFFKSISKTMHLQEGQVTVSAPASKLTSTALLKKSGFPEELFGLTYSCHVHEYACGQCAGCQKHRTVIDQVRGTELA